MFLNAIKISLAFFYLLSINVPLIYYVEHKINLDYIVKNLCEQKDEEENLCLGNCYLKKNLTKTEQPEKQAEQNTLKIPGNSVSPHFTSSADIYFSQLIKKKKYYSLTVLQIPEIFIAPTVLPPELLLS